MDIETAKISLDLAASAPDTQITIMIDDQTIWSGDPYNAGTVTMDIDDLVGEHVMEIMLSGKTAEHTRIDPEGCILEDLLVDVRNICMDRIIADQIFYDKSTYSHDFNGTQQPIEDKFYGHMGCNGVVRLAFTTPIYLWLLENM